MYSYTQNSPESYKDNFIAKCKSYSFQSDYDKTYDKMYCDRSQRMYVPTFESNQVSYHGMGKMKINIPSTPNQVNISAYYTDGTPINYPIFVLGDYLFFDARLEGKQVVLDTFSILPFMQEVPNFYSGNIVLKNNTYGKI